MSDQQMRINELEVQVGSLKTSNKELKAERDMFQVRYTRMTQRRDVSLDWFVQAKLHYAFLWAAIGLVFLVVSLAWGLYQLAEDSFTPEIFIAVIPIATCFWRAFHWYYYSLVIKDQVISEDRLLAYRANDEADAESSENPDER